MGKLNDLHSLTATLLRGGRGFVALWPATEPQVRLELYEFESCPYCRKVREAFSELDLEYLARPCAKGSRNRVTVRELGGREMFPFLVDPNTGQSMYESEDIIEYLHQRYGRGRRGMLFRAASPFNTLTSSLASVVRHRGGKVRGGGRRPERLLEIYNFEASPYCRKVRETLAELDLDYVVHNVARNSRRRADLVARGGKMLVPYLIDPNTGAEMYESDDIVAYLRRTWG